MLKAILGGTGLGVTKLGFGAMEIRGPCIWNGWPMTDSEHKKGRLIYALSQTWKIQY